MAASIAKIIIAAAIMVDIVGVGSKLPEPTPVAVTVESETPVFEENSQKTEEYVPQTAPSWQNSFKQYRVNGVTPPYEWQWYLYGQLANRGIEWFYPYAVCQIYQESNWNQWADNGRDKGLCQQKAVYWADRAAAAGIPGADIWSVNAQLYVYSHMMAQYLAASGYSVERALSMYYLGADGYAAEYVGHVLRWLDCLGE